MCWWRGWREREIIILEVIVIFLLWQVICLQYISKSGTGAKQGLSPRAAKLSVSILSVTVCLDIVSHCVPRYCQSLVPRYCQSLCA